MALLIDSTVLIGLERRGGDAGEFGSVTHDEHLAIAAITASEILVGVYNADSTQRRITRERWVEDALGRLPLLPFELAVARQYAKLWADLSADGNMIGLHDIQVAATALTRGYGVLTDNVRDFERVPGLVVRKPVWS
jgi:tRNA(fMet)-specific endonuclease VapC